MSDATKLDPRSLTSEERAWCDAIAVALCSSGNYSAAGAISEAVTLGLPERRALFGEPASEGGKVYSCPKCKASEEGHYDCLTQRYSCQPASEPAQAECPNCGQAVPHAFDHVTGWANGGAKLYICKPASEGGKVECPNCLQKVPGELEHWHSGYSDDNCTVGPHYICAQSSPVWQEVQPANAHARSSLPGTNSGHGHAWPRPDGIKARCGGVGLCKICSADALLVKVSISEPAQPEPVAEEMPEAKRKHNPDLKLDFIAAGWAKTADGWIAPVDELPEAVRLAAYHLRTSASDYESRSRAGQIDILNECAKVQRDAADALESFWRTHAVQPAPAAAMTEELSRVIDAANKYANDLADCNPGGYSKLLSDMGAVLKQAAEAGKVRLPAELEALLRTFASGQGINVARLREVCRAVFAELDAVEGRK